MATADQVLILAHKLPVLSKEQVARIERAVTKATPDQMEVLYEKLSLLGEALLKSVHEAKSVVAEAKMALKTIHGKEITSQLHAQEAAEHSQELADVETLLKTL